MGKKALVLVNAAARQGRTPIFSRRVARELLDEATRQGFELAPIKSPTADATPAAINEALAEHDPDRIVLVGGDGLIHRALPALVDAPISVGIVPAGTGNDFARGLGLPSRLKAAVRAAFSSEVTAVDTIAVKLDAGDGDEAATPVASVLTAGFSGYVNDRAERIKRYVKGSSRYTIAALAELSKLQPAAMRVAVDGEEIFNSDATMLAVGNTSFFGGGMKICPEASAVDGLIDVVIVGPVGRTELAFVLPSVFWGKHMNHRSVTSSKGLSVEIESELELWADGELLDFGGHKVCVNANSGSLKLLMNAAT